MRAAEPGERLSKILEARGILIGSDMPDAGEWIKGREVLSIVGSATLLAGYGLAGSWKLGHPMSRGTIAGWGGQQS